MVKFRAWHKTWEEMGKVKRIRFDDEGNITTVLVKGQAFGSNVHLEEIELMQSTGLKDKNGKEVFEGDILASETYPVNGAVEYRAKLGMWVNCLKEYSYYEYLGNVASDRKIIGNIYENPEFLEVEE